MREQKRNTQSKPIKNSGNRTAEAGRKPKKQSLCPVSAKCGGCRYIDMPYSEQLKIKRKNVQKILEPFGRLEEMIGMEDPFHYRNKVHAVYDFQKGKYELHPPHFLVKSC